MVKLLLSFFLNISFFVPIIFLNFLNTILLFYSIYIIRVFILIKIGNICTIEVDKVEKEIYLKNRMTETTKNLTERLKEEQSVDETIITTKMKSKSNGETRNKPENKVLSKNEINKSSEIKVKLKDGLKKVPEIKVQPVKESADIEHTKSRISRNVAINRSFNTNSKLELLRYIKILI